MGLNEFSVNSSHKDALGDLRGVLARFKPGHKIYDEIVTPREQVFARYRPIFSSEHVPGLTKDEFTSFLYFENNHHWSGLYRKGLGAAVNIEALRQGLAVLLDESRPIRERFPDALGTVSGLGKAIATAILIVAYPDRYGVWNNTSEAALRQLGLWPRPTSAPFAQGGESFALERQLQEFLLENWERTPLAKEWIIFNTPDDPEAGNEYPTDIGRIDILAVHKEQPRYLIVELKRNQSSDQTVGQALRYMGWVKKHLAKHGQSVEALIISNRADKSAQYALSTLPNVSMMTYEIEFRLKDLEALPE